jgi:YesN/AraC family two-component response regulator
VIYLSIYYNNGVTVYNILIVDDDKIIVNALYEYITEYCDIEIVKNIQMDITTDSLEALKLVRVKKYHIIATDLKMPKLNGHQLLIEAKKHDAYQKAILFSAYADKAIVQDLLNNGLIDVVLDKPLKLYEFRDYVLKILQTCETEDTEYQNAITKIASAILHGKNLAGVTEDILTSLIIQGNLNVLDIAEKTGINKDKLYGIKRGMKLSKN